MLYSGLVTWGSFISLLSPANIFWVSHISTSLCRENGMETKKKNMVFIIQILLNMVGHLQHKYIFQKRLYSTKERKLKRLYRKSGCELARFWKDKKKGHSRKEKQHLKNDTEGNYKECLRNAIFSYMLICQAKNKSNRENGNSYATEQYHLFKYTHLHACIHEGYP